MRQTEREKERKRERERERETEREKYIYERKDMRIVLYRWTTF